MAAADPDYEMQDSLMLLAHAEEAELDALSRVHVALDAGYADPDFTQEEAARLAGMSTRRLRYLLGNDGVGTSYRFEVDRRRMAKAKRLLEGTNYLISAIGEHCGYRNASAFCKRFKEHYGLSPKQYRIGLGGAKRAGGPTGAAWRPAARARAASEGAPVTSRRRPGPAPGEEEAWLADVAHAERQAQAFGRTEEEDSWDSIAGVAHAWTTKRRRGAPR
jgi:AraC-like DNA-binding protein